MELLEQCPKAIFETVPQASTFSIQEANPEQNRIFPVHTLDLRYLSLKYIWHNIETNAYFFFINFFYYIMHTISCLRCKTESLIFCVFIAEY